MYKCVKLIAYSLYILTFPYINIPLQCEILCGLLQLKTNTCIIIPACVYPHCKNAGPIYPELDRMDKCNFEVEINLAALILCYCRPTSPTGPGMPDPEPSNDPTFDSNTDSRCFDSTGMFHWCVEQPLSTCLMVSISQF